jgi:Xaa-Pro aminopeptidase
MKRAKARAQRTAARLLYAASEQDADILYATRFFAPDPFLFVSTGERLVLVTSDLERDRARAQATVDEVWSWTENARALEAQGETPTAAAVITRVLRVLKVRRVEVPRNFSLGLAMELDAAGGGRARGGPAGAAGMHGGERRLAEA